MDKPLALALVMFFMLLQTVNSHGMFVSRTDEYIDPGSNPTQLNYGVAVSDVDLDGEFDFIVAGFNGPNLVLKWNSTSEQLENIAIDDTSSPYYNLRDPEGQAIGVCACDIDGDGTEEIYFLNTNNAFSGVAAYGDKLFKFRNGKYEDLFSDVVNSNVKNYFAGRSVACVDRRGTGRYGFFLANYNSGDVGPFALFEMDDALSDVSSGSIVIRDVATEAGTDKLTGGRGVAVGPILNDNGRSDVFTVNERGPNFLFRNLGDGTFEEVAAEYGVDDPDGNGRGVALADLNNDRLIDLVYGNWEGPHRIFMQQPTVGGGRSFRNAASVSSSNFTVPSSIRTVIVSDFDNDGIQEIFMNNIYRGVGPEPNYVYKVYTGGMDGNPTVEEVDIGDALEPEGAGTGGAVADINGDGLLELLLSHGESSSQPLTIYNPTHSTDKNYIRILPKTPSGAPARGAKVLLYTDNCAVQAKIIDGGSGYLNQMEPVAHFGLGSTTANLVEIIWPDTKTLSRSISDADHGTTVHVDHPDNQPIVCS
ncbi:cartilage acidic protein 1-like [Ptychodera flava]|uniref:cartilage acidic protein 1-like n=1 Tax=Ptychodera flava TaxID=63121 RepID=UPI00396A4852